MAKIKRHNDADDAGYKKTDEQLKELEGRLSSLYADAGTELTNKLEAYMKQFDKEDAIMSRRLANDQISKEEYERWRRDKIATSHKMEIQLESFAETLVNTDKMAMQMVSGELPSIYAVNYNFQGFKAEKMAQAGGVDYSSFTIYNADAVSRLAKQNPNLLPRPTVDIPKDTRWNKQKINSAITQGIIQGDPIDTIAERLQAVTDMDMNAAIRNARTATIGAQNAGRAHASERIRITSGLEMVDVWSCTHDARTRDTHIMMDGQERDEEGFFTLPTGDRLEYPGDPNGPPAEVYNCRCRLDTFIKNIDHSKDDELYEEFMKANYFDEWVSNKVKQDEKVAGYNANKAEAEERMRRKEDRLKKMRGK